MLMLTDQPSPPFLGLPLEIAVALIGVIGVVLGAVLNFLIPFILEKLRSKGRVHSIVGSWASAWGPLPNGPTAESGLLVVTKQRGMQISATLSWEKQSDHKWDCTGRYDGQFLQLLYYPAKDALNQNFLDYGCFFMRRQADGNFAGISAGFGSYDETQVKDIAVHYHVLRRS